jgi:hypothetical protein
VQQLVRRQTEISKPLAPEDRERCPRQQRRGIEIFCKGPEYDRFIEVKEGLSALLRPKALVTIAARSKVSHDDFKKVTAVDCEAVPLG